MNETEKRCPTCGGQVTSDQLRPDCVAFVIELEGSNVPLIVRLKSARAVKNVIEALKRHGAGCWPEAMRT